jgi:hypothetical protein
MHAKAFTAPSRVASVRSARTALVGRPSASRSRSVAVSANGSGLPIDLRGERVTHSWAA